MDISLSTVKILVQLLALMLNTRIPLYLQICHKVNLELLIYNDIYILKYLKMLVASSYLAALYSKPLSVEYSIHTLPQFTV